MVLTITGISGLVFTLELDCGSNWLEIEILEASFDHWGEARFRNAAKNSRRETS